MSVWCLGSAWIAVILGKLWPVGKCCSSRGRGSAHRITESSVIHFPVTAAGRRQRNSQSARFIRFKRTLWNKCQKYLGYANITSQVSSQLQAPSVSVAHPRNVAGRQQVFHRQSPDLWGAILCWFTAVISARHLLVGWDWPPGTCFEGC